MRKASVIIIILLSVLCVGCYKQVHCPGLPANLDYFPYYDGQILKYANSQQNVINFVIGQVENHTKSYTCQESPKCPECKCGCAFSKAFRTGNVLQNGVTYIYASFSTEGSGPKTITSVGIGLLFTCFVDDWSHNRFNKIVYQGKKISYNQVDEYLEDTVLLENENNMIITKAVIVKGKGLVSYTTADGEEWELIE